MVNTSNKKQTKSNKLTDLFWVNLSVLFYLFCTLIISFIFKEQLVWITHPNIFFGSLALLSILQLLIFILIEFFKIKRLWQGTFIFWIIGHWFLIYSLGGLNSPFLFIIFFVPVITLFMLSVKNQLRSAIVTSLILISFFFLKSENYLDVSNLIKFTVPLIGYILLSFYFYLFVKGTMTSSLESDRLKRKVQQLEELDHTKQVFLSSMSHQMRTPLSGAKWAFEEVLRDSNTPHVDILKEGHRRVEEAINTITEILKTAELDIDKNNIQIKKTEFDFKDLIEQIILNLDYLIRSNSIDVVYEKLDFIKVMGDSKMLSMALSNIFDNAFRYAPKGQVTVNLFQNDTEAILTVQDNGIGIDKNDLEFVTFQKFYRGKNAMSIDPNESGVGLYTTRKIIELHGGRMAISSTLGQGTKVSVTLPL